MTAIRDLRVGESAQVEGRVEAIEKGFRYRPQLRIAIGDDSHNTLVLRFFHFNNVQVNQLSIGARLRCFGEVRHGKHGLEMVHPQYQRIADAAPAEVEERLTPVYPTTEGLGTKRLGGVIRRALAELPPDEKLELIPPALRRARVSAARCRLYAYAAAGCRPCRLGRSDPSAQRRLAFEGC
jgi:ATP-dependent DNA helicase RecG